MRHRFLLSLSATAAVIAALATVSVMAQASKPAAKATASARAVLRTAWGAPDLQGVWDFRTITPLERPKDLSGKAVLSDVEAAEFETRQNVRNDRETNVPKGNVGDYNQFWYDWGTRILGAKRTSLITDPADGRIPPLTAEAQKKRDALAEKRKGVEADTPTPGGFVQDLGPGGLRVRCILGFNSGPPMTPSAYNNNVQIFQTPTHVGLLNEMVHNARMVPLDGRPHGTLRQWVGDSRGRWDGNTLVVDTVNFKEPPLAGGATMSENMHLVERFTRLDAETLLYEFTVEDPKTWTKPWTAQMYMVKNPEPVYEYACHEGNYGLYNILSGALKRDEAAAKKGSQ
ncbi:MAG TPA: hypothetical protein VGQ10_03365 [Vicinamibacterales bacterium]|jgi:hypothetical protein|nr:hypothetical protein [Vicinamibacterales bacterium]